MRIILTIIGYLLWLELCRIIIGPEATLGLFLTQAIYARIIYFRDEQIYETLTPEVIDEPTRQH